MISWFFFLIILTGFIRIIFFKNYLIILISIELIIFSIYIIILVSSEKLNIRIDIIFLYLSIIIVEGVFGLSLLINFSNSFGNDTIIL